MRHKEDKNTPFTSKLKGTNHFLEVRTLWLVLTTLKAGVWMFLGRGTAKGLPLKMVDREIEVQTCACMNGCIYVHVFLFSNVRGAR